MRLHIADGAKGGVGKSQTAQVLINYLSRDNKPVIVFETDTQIPDVARCVQKTARNIRLELADIRTDDGWQAMLEDLQDIATDDNASNIDAVLSLPGADLDIPRYTDLVSELTEALNIEIWDWFVLNTQSDSVALLTESLKTGFASIAKKRIAVKNGFFGRSELFLAFDESKIAKKLDAVIYLDALSSGAAKSLRAESILIDEAILAAKSGVSGGKPNILYASNLQAWIRKVDAELSRVIS